MSDRTRECQSGQMGQIQGLVGSSLRRFESCLPHPMSPTILSGCVIIQNEHLLLLFKRKRQHYEFPGGKVEPNESLMNAAVRETKEEIGCIVDIINYLGYKEFSIEGNNFRSHKFLAQIQQGMTPYIAEPDAFDHLVWMPIADHTNYIVAPNVTAFCSDYLVNGLENIRQPFP